MNKKRISELPCFISVYNTAGGYPYHAFVEIEREGNEYWLGGSTDVAMFATYQEAYNVVRRLKRSWKRFNPLRFKIHRLREVEKL